MKIPCRRCSWIEVVENCRRAAVSDDADDAEQVARQKHALFLDRRRLVAAAFGLTGEDNGND